MCSKFFLRPHVGDILDAIRELGGDPGEILERPDWRERVAGIRPSDQALLVREVDGASQVTWARWGLIPSWHQVRVLERDTEPGKTPAGRWRGLKASTHNARADRVDQIRPRRSMWRPMWRRRQRCVLLASGFFEGSAVVESKEAPVVYLAGLWDTWTPVVHAETFDTVLSCAVVTAEPDEVVAQVHDRSPVALSVDEARQWVSAGVDHEAAGWLLRPRPGPWAVR